MGTMASFIIMLLKLVSALMSFARDRQMLKAGADAEIARASAQVLMMTQAAKETMAKVTAMNEEQVDAMMKDLEP